MTPGQRGHRTPGIEPAVERAPQGHLRLRRLRPAAVLLRDKVRERHRLAEFLPAAPAALLSAMASTPGRNRPACATAWTALRWCSPPPRQPPPDALSPAIV